MRRWIFNLIAWMAGAITCFGQSDYLPFTDSTFIYANDTDTLVYRYSLNSNPNSCYVKVTDNHSATTRDARISIFDGIIYEQYSDGLKVRLFSLKPQKGEKYMDQDVTTEVISVKEKLKIGKKTYQDVVCVKRIEFGSFVTHYYFAKGVGLIRREEPNQKPLDLILK